MLVLQEKNLSLPEPLHDFLATQIARHLDPYIDGDIATAEDVTDNTPMYTRLKEKYQAAHGRELPCPAEVVLAMYVRHGVCKCDAYQCFTDLVMGQGRLPEGGDKNQKHCKALGKALAAAITKDFGKENAKIQGVQISAQVIEELAKTHSDRLFYDHQRNAERLAEANRVGEIGRKEEMKRIFGIEI